MAHRSPLTGPYPSKHTVRRHAAAQDSFLGRLLDPIDLLSETIYSILILMTFTFAFRLIKLGPNVAYDAAPASYMNELLIGALSAIVAWGAIDGIMYALMAVLARGESHRLLHNIQAAGDDEEAAVQVIADEFDYLLDPITGAEQRRGLYQDINAHLRHSRPQPVRFRREDLAGAFGSLLVALIAVLPSLTPLYLLRQYPATAIHVSNLVSFFMLFVAGYQWGRYTGGNPWKFGLSLSAVSAAMLYIAVLLGG